MKKLSITLCTLFLAALAAGPVTAATYYVSPRGNDASPGTKSKPWQTITRVNNQRLAARDAVLFEGGQTFAGPLVPWGSGNAAAPVRYASYGEGRATIASRDSGAVWFPGNRYVVLEDLRLTSEGSKNHIVASNANATTAFVTIRNCTVVDSGAFGINSPSLSDHDWTIENNVIGLIAETGITFRGARFRVIANTIVETGIDPSEGAHGVYAKGPAAQVIGNRIFDFAASAVSIRYENSIVRQNRIAGGLIGVSQFQDKGVTVGGTSLIADNTISDVTEAGIYLDGSTLESFTIARNTISSSARSGLNIHAVRSLTIIGNTVKGPFEKYVLVVQRPARAYVERDNSWLSARGEVFGWEGRVLDFAGYRRASGQGAGDRISG